jgi:hypothetical protein
MMINTNAEEFRHILREMSMLARMHNNTVMKRKDHG